MERATMNCPSCKAAWTLGQSASRPAVCPFCGASLADKDEQPDASTIQGVVRAMILEYGAELYYKNKFRLLKSLVNDLAASFSRERKVLNIVIQEGVQERLLKADGGTDDEKRVAAARCRTYLTEDAGIADERAVEAVNILAAGLGWKPPLEASLEKTAQTSAEGAREIVVAADGSGDYAALQEAIDATAAGGSIRIKPGVYKGGVRLEKPLTIKGVDGSICARASKDLPVLLLGPDGRLTVTERAAGARISGVVFTQFAEKFKNLAKYSGQRDDFDEKSTDERAKALSAWLKRNEKERPDGYLAHIAGAVEFHDTALLCPMAELCEISAGEPLFSDCFFGRGLCFDNRFGTAVYIKNDASPVMRRCSFGGVVLHLYDKAGGTYENCDIHDNKWNGICIFDSAAPTIENCKIYNNGEENKRHPAIWVGNSAEPTVRNCEMYGHSGSGLLILDDAGGTYEDCNIHDNKYNGIDIRGSAEPTIKNCKVHDSKEHGIGISESAAPAIENCKIYNNGEKDTRWTAILVWGFAKPTVRNCEIYGNSGGGISIRDSTGGIYEDCNIHDNKCSGIYIEGSVKPTIENCNIHNNKNNGICIGDSAEPTIKYCKIYNNGEKVKSWLAIWVKSWPAIWVRDSAKPTVRNCEMYGHPGCGIAILGNASGTYEDCNIHDNGAYEDNVWNNSSGNPVIRNC